MNCPYCNSELDYPDYYGFYSPGIGFTKISGNIYICPNGRELNGCEYDGHFYDRNDEILREGYPC